MKQFNVYFVEKIDYIKEKEKQVNIELISNFDMQEAFEINTFFDKIPSLSLQIFFKIFVETYNTK